MIDIADVTGVPANAAGLGLSVFEYSPRVAMAIDEIRALIDAVFKPL